MGNYLPASPKTPVITESVNTNSSKESAVVSFEQFIDWAQDAQLVGWGVLHPIQSIEVDEEGFELVVMGEYIHGDDSNIITVRSEGGNSRIFFEADGEEISPLIWGDTASIQIRDNGDLVTPLRFEK